MHKIQIRLQGERSVKMTQSQAVSADDKATAAQGRTLAVCEPLRLFMKMCCENSPSNKRQRHVCATPEHKSVCLQVSEVASVTSSGAGPSVDSECLRLIDENKGRRQTQAPKTHQISKQYGRTDDPPKSHVNVPLPAPTHTQTQDLDGTL